MKILYATDLHITDRQPPSRKDDYFKSVCKKVQQISVLARWHNVDKIIFGGDVTHIPNESYKVFCRCLELFKAFPVKPETLIGLTHDFSQTEKNIEKSILWALKEAGAIDLHGQSHMWDLDGFKVYGAHMSITPVPFFGHYVLYQDLDVECDIVLVSHLHMPFGIKVVNGKTFVSPGSIARNTCDMFNLNRKPQVAMIEIALGKADIYFIPLDVETNVFDEQYLVNKSLIHDEQEMRSVDEVRDMVIENVVIDMDSVVKTVAKRYSPDVFEEAMKMMKENEC